MLQYLPARDATWDADPIWITVVHFRGSRIRGGSGVPELNQEGNDWRRVVGNDGDLSTSSPPKESLWSWTTDAMQQTG